MGSQRVKHDLVTQQQGMKYRERSVFLQWVILPAPSLALKPEDAQEMLVTLTGANTMLTRKYTKCRHPLIYPLSSMRLLGGVSQVEFPWFVLSLGLNGYL